jgi:hypothetical protein
MSSRERIRAEEQDRAHHILRERGADAHGVAPHEVALQSAQILVSDAHRGEIAEAGVHAVDRIVTFRDLRDDPRRLLDLTLRGAIEADGDVAARDSDDVGDRKVAACQAEGGHS